MTIDQRGSRNDYDRVPELIRVLNRAISGLVLPFARTQGDELQGVTGDPGEAVKAALAALRVAQWSVGIGAGPVDEPLPASSPEARGPAFVLARQAVEAAKGGRRVLPPVAVRSAQADLARDCESALQLLATLRAERSSQGWEACDLMSQTGMTGRQAARRLGISPQALGDRLKAAHWHLDCQALRLSIRLMSVLDETIQA
ncbi:MAG: hypothetical protein LBJ02_10070 [Bifidobacteriaceae bacterium]|nr:hypothetical protein [Bifidobacteriaceae bacterium]